MIAPALSPQTRTDLHRSPHRPAAVFRLLAALSLAALLLAPAAATAGDVLILARSVILRLTPHITGKELGAVFAGESYDFVRRPSGKPARYVLDDQGILWLQIRVSDDLVGWVQTDQVSIAREEFRSPRGTPLLLVNIRTTADGGTDRDLWLIPEQWHRARRLVEIEGRPIWSPSGDWFLCQVDTGQAVRDPLMERSVERIERFTADGRTRTVLATGTQPLLHPGRNEVFFYRDVDEHGDPVPAGLYVVSANGGHTTRPVFLLPERYRFWKETGDYFVQAPPAILQAAANRILFFAYEKSGVLVRYTVGLDGHLLEMRRE